MVTHVQLFVDSTEPDETINETRRDFRRRSRDISCFLVGRRENYWATLSLRTRYAALVGVLASY